MKKVGVDGEGRFAALVLRHWNLVLLGKVDEIGAALEGPFPPRCNDANIGIQRVCGQFEAHLIVALAGGAMGDRIGSRVAGDLDQTFCDQGTRNGSSQKIDALIKGVGAKHRKNEISYELVAQVFDEDLLDAEKLGL